MSPAVTARKLSDSLAASTGGAEAVVTGFGRTALFLALRAAGARGKEILVPDFICRHVPQAVREAGGTPVFYRLEADLNITPPALEAVATRNTLAVIVAHYFGEPQPGILELAKWCRGRRIFLIEDCALALGAVHPAGPVGSFGDFSIFSFSKSHWSYGGGAVISRAAVNPSLGELARRQLRSYPRLQRNYGILRRADFAANRPRLARPAAFAGKWLESLLGCRENNFFDSGRFDAAATPQVGRRIAAIFAGLPEDIARRRSALRLLAEVMSCRLGQPPRPARFGNSENISGAYLRIETPPGEAAEWFEAGNRDGISLRMVWPAYERAEEAQDSASLRRLAGSQLYLEIHPELREAEIGRIAGVIAGLAARSVESRGCTGGAQ